MKNDIQMKNQQLKKYEAEVSKLKSNEVRLSQRIKQQNELIDKFTNQSKQSLFNCDSGTRTHQAGQSSNRSKIFDSPKMNLQFDLQLQHIPPIPSFTVSGMASSQSKDTATQGAKTPAQDKSQSQIQLADVTNHQNNTDAALAPKGSSLLPDG